MKKLFVHTWNEENRKLFGAFIFLFFFIPKFIFAQKDSLSLNQAIAIAQENALGKKKVQADFWVAQNNKNYNLALLKPQLSLSTVLPNYYKTRSAITQPDGTISFLPISQDNSSIGLNLSQRILATNTQFFAESTIRRYSDFTENGLKNFNSVPFRFGIEQPLNAVNNLKWNKKLLALDEEIAAVNLSMNKEEISSQVTQAYFELLAAQTEYKIAETNRQSNEKIYAIALERDNLGKISKSDLLQLELSLNTANQAKIRARREVFRSNARFKEAMGFSMGNDEIFLVLAPEILGSKEFDSKFLAEKAWQRRPEIKQLEKLLLQTERELENARKNNAWQGTLSATLGWVGTDPAFGGAYQIPQVENFVQLSLRVPILDGGKRKYALKAAQYQREYQEMENTFSEQVFKQNVRQLVQQFQELKEEVEFGAKSFQLAGERYEIANQRYILNDISITDLSIAFSERDNAWRGYISLLRAYWTTYYALRLISLEEF